MEEKQRTRDKKRHRENERAGEKRVTQKKLKEWKKKTSETIQRDRTRE